LAGRIYTAISDQTFYGAIRTAVRDYDPFNRFRKNSYCILLKFPKFVADLNNPTNP